MEASASAVDVSLSYVIFKFSWLVTDTSLFISFCQPSTVEAMRRLVNFMMGEIDPGKVRYVKFVQPLYASTVTSLILMPRVCVCVPERG